MSKLRLQLRRRNHEVTAVIFFMLATAFFALGAVLSRNPRMAERSRRRTAILFFVAGALSFAAAIGYLLRG